MLDLICVFHESGVVLWELRNSGDVPPTLVADVVARQLLEQSVASGAVTHAEHAVKFTRDNELGLVFLAVYRKVLALTHVDALLDALKREFVAAHGAALRAQRRVPARALPAFAFDDAFRLVERAAEAAADAAAAPAASGAPRRFAETAKGRRARAKAAESGTADAAAAVAADDDARLSDAERRAREVRRNVERLRAKRGGAARRGGAGRGAAASPSPSPSAKKAARGWSDKTSRKEAAQLDLSEPASPASAEDDEAKIARLRSELRADEQIDLAFDDDDDDDGGGVPDEAPSSGIWGYLGRLANGTVLTPDDLAPVLAQFRNHLVAKNVASDIAKRICDAVGKSLEGRTVGTFASLSNVVRESLDDELTRILTPQRPIDILRDVRAAKRERRPFSIVMIGVNGVGKSTSLAKISAWLMQNQHSVLIAACDTFRSGAVEQLRVHTKCIGAALFERGYNKDASAVAEAAIAQAHADGTDVVMIDTAGRMQDNEPLMRSLAKLVSKNRPDLILFVGEALVGNEAVDQVQKFNAALIDYAPQRANARQVDGIMLTKFDTIDDQVGAVVSMTHTVGRPVVFVGTGQHYTDLKRLQIKQIVNALLR